MAKPPTSPQFDPDLIVAACKEAKLDAIADLCDAIRVALRDRPPGEKHPVSRDGHISDSLAANYACRMLRGCVLEQTVPPPELAELFKIILKQDRPPAGSDRKYVELQEARRYMARKPAAGVNEIARAVGVNRSTVSRWKAKGVLH